MELGPSCIITAAAEAAVLPLASRWPDGSMLLLQMLGLAARVVASVQEKARDVAPRLPLEEQRMTLPSVGCWSSECDNMATPGEDTLHVRTCATCGVAKYCTVACQKAHRRAHKAACRSRA